MIKLIIGADIVPTVSNQSIFENAKLEQIVDRKLFNVLNNADFRCFNLEVPLTDKETPINKKGPNLLASKKCINGLMQLNINFMTLANNHILDQGDQGLFSTTCLLKEAGIAYAGVGENLEEASKPYIVNIDDKKIGFYCCAEHEFSIAGKMKPGANPFDPLESLDHIADLKAICDYVICLYHGGKEHYRYPSPDLQKVCRKIAEKGADLVVCQHSHCIGCQEEWKGCTIVYGQGNFLFDYSNSEYWKTSLLISVDISSNGLIVGYIPIIKNGCGVKVADSNIAENILKEFQNRSIQIKQACFIEQEYEKLANLFLSTYLSPTDSIASSILFRVLNKISMNHLRAAWLSRKVRCNRERLINQYMCEAHRELILKGLEVFER